GAGGGVGGRAGGPGGLGADDLRPAGGTRGAFTGTGGPGGGPALAPSTLQAGVRVRHKVFGEGTVVSCTPAGGDTVVTVSFPEQGVKKLLASVAPLEKL